MAEVTRLVIYDSVLFNRVGRPGLIAAWAERVSVRLGMNARIEAPIGTRANKSRRNAEFPVGSLAASISEDVDRIGPKHLQIVVSVNVPYATYVLGGTPPVIYARNSYFTLKDGTPAMYVPPNPGYGTRTRHAVVSGQAPNNFLARAAERTARTHRSLQGFVPGGFG